MKLLAVVLSSCALVACGGGGGGSSSSAPNVTQAEATDVVNSVDSAQGLLLETLPAYYQQQTILFGLPSTQNISQVSTVNCSQSGSYVQTYTKGSAGAGSITSGDTISIVYSGCYDGTSTITGTLSSTAAIIGSSIRLQLQATNYTRLYASNGISINFSGSFTADNSNTANPTWTISGVGPLTGTLAGFSTSGFYKNGSYTLNSFGYTNSIASSTSGTRSYTYTMPYVGTDNANYVLNLATSTPVTRDYTVNSTKPVITPGLFAISGYKQSSIQVTNDSSSSSTVKVSNGANGTFDLTFTLFGFYFS